MANVPKGSFPGCLRKKIVKKRVKNLNHHGISLRWESNLQITEQIIKNLRRFQDIFGGSDEDEEFHGFSSEECGLIAYKHVNGSRGRRHIPGILVSPIDFSKKNVTTRLAHARRSLDELPSSRKTVKKKHRKTLKAQGSGGEKYDTPLKPFARHHESDSQSSDSESSGFTKYKNSNLDFHRLSKSAISRPTISPHQLPHSKHKNSPIKPATFIAPSFSHENKHHVTNVTPTCLKIQINKIDSENAQNVAKSSLAGNSKRGKNSKISSQPLHTSTPITSCAVRSKARSFVLPTKSSRSSRIIKANRKYIDSDDNVSKESDRKPELTLSPFEKSSKETDPSTTKASSAQGRLLLKQPTFRVAALARINNRPQTSRLLSKDSGISTRMRARKLIKRARFKHPTSSSTLVVGNDFDEDDIKKNLIREATFKMPSKSGKDATEPDIKSSFLSDLGLTAHVWNKLTKNEIRTTGSAPAWTRQEIHNLLHGAHTFANSWQRIARHYEYQPLHRDWQCIKAKLKTLQHYGLLSSNLKVKSSVLLQLKHRYSDNQNENAESGALSVDEENEEVPPSKVQRGREALRKYHLKCYKRWVESLSSVRNSLSVYLGLEKKAFMSLCNPQQSCNNQESWSVREIHNIVHGFHIFGLNEWPVIHKMYVFQKTHDHTELRTKFKSVRSRGLLTQGKVKNEVLKSLQPLLTPEGMKYFELTLRKNRIPTKHARRPSLSEATKKGERKSARKRAPVQDDDDDLKSPPRKQAYHLFGTAPVWDESSSPTGLTSLEAPLSGNEERKQTGNEDSGSNRKIKKTRRKDRIESKARKIRNNGNNKSSVSVKGPRIKHVCRRASLVTGKKIAVYCKEQSDLHLSALPKKERERIAAEVERHRGAPSDTTITSESEDDLVGTPKKFAKRSERILKVIGKKKNSKVSNKPRCKMCKNCKLPPCGVCSYCRHLSGSGTCLEQPRCLNPPLNIAKNGSKKSNGTQKQSSSQNLSMETRKTSPNLHERQQDPPTSSGPVGIILSPNSRQRLQQELHEHARQLPSIVRIDEWKERYELEDLWTTGGVSIITSTTPSTRFLCFLCGSLGKARPLRRSSTESDASAESTENFEQKPLLIFCCSCCEPFHPFCLEDHEQQTAINSAKKGNWICKRCRFCNVCGRTNKLLECRRCSKTYHSTCLGPGYPNKQSKNQVWVCMRCVRCRSCGASKPGRRPGSKWTHDFQLCQRCGDLFDKGNFCPICRRCYRDEDYESRMIQCGTCKRWVHSRCESLTNEMYALLSHLPDDVPYVCPDCDGRRNKVEIEFNDRCDSAILDDGDCESGLGGEKMKDLLQKLPSPPWRKILEDEVQSGIESVMMTLFHNKEAACILKKTVAQEDPSVGRPVDLFAVRFAVHNRRYSSVGQFSSDVCYILDTITEIAPLNDVQASLQGKRKRPNEGGPRNAFCKEMQQIFPWFDVETGRVRDTSDVPEDLLPHATLPPYCDHNYAQWQDRDIAISALPETPLKNVQCESTVNTDSVGMVLWSLTSQTQFDDRRQCLFCGKYGDEVPTVAGRLVYCGQDEWVHVNCALWSAEVFERHDGSLQNVYSAVSRGRMMKCELCKLPGATVGCNTRDCPQNFHFACAKLAQCSFQDDKKVFCPKHVKNIDSELVSEEGFEVARRVVVDSDEMRPNRRWQRGVQSDNVTILMGSAIIHQLGHLTVASDSKDYLIPVHFRMTRMFWSTVNAGRKVKYTITVAEQKSVLETTPYSKNRTFTKGEKTEHENHTISHADEDESSQVGKLKRKLSSEDVACKSNLLQRLQAVETHVIERRKSYDEPGPEVPRSRRFSGPSYTVVGISNRTLPQNITPIPSALETSSLFHGGPTTLSTATSTSATPSNSIVTKRNCDFEKNVVRVSYQNPYLNIKIGERKEPTQDQKMIIDPEVLKAMDQCLADTGNQHVSQTSKQKVAVPLLVSPVNVESPLNPGISGSLLQNSNQVHFTKPDETENSTPAPPILHESILIDKPNDLEDHDGSNDLTPPCENNIELPAIPVSSKTGISANQKSNDSAKDVYIQDKLNTPEHDVVAGVPLDPPSGTLLSKNNELTEISAEFEESKAVIEKSSEDVVVEESPAAHSISLLQKAKNAHSVVSVSSQSPEEDVSVKLWWKSNMKEGCQRRCIKVPKAKICAIEDDDDFIPSTEMDPTTSSVVTRLKKSKSIDSLESDSTYNEDQRREQVSDSSVKHLQVVLHDINNTDPVDIRKSGRLAEDALRKNDELFSDHVRSSDGYSSSIDSCGIPDTQAPAAYSKVKSFQLKKKKLRNFAKPTRGTNDTSLKRVTRSKSQLTKTTDIRKLSSNHPSKSSINADAPALSPGKSVDRTASRLRSKSVDSSAKTRLQTADGHRRYPRRNPYTCLQSFFGLSPNYAIQSYSPKNQDRLECSISRSLKKMGNKKSLKPPERSKRSVKTVTQEKSCQRQILMPAVDSTRRRCRSSVSEVSMKSTARKAALGSGRSGSKRSRSLGSLRRKSCSTEFLKKTEGSGDFTLPLRNDTADDISFSEVPSGAVSKEEERNMDTEAVPQDENRKEAATEVSDNDSGDSLEAEIPPIEETRGIIDMEAQASSAVNVDDSNQEVLKLTENTTPLQSLPISPLKISMSNEIVNDQTESTQNHNVNDPISLAPEPSDVRQDVHSKPIQNLMTLDGISSCPLPVHMSHLGSRAHQTPMGLNFNSLEDFESPLSPRDEPNLPPPVETEAAASSFLVTSECPVLNVDEVQSILAMPQTDTRTSTSCHVAAGPTSSYCYAPQNLNGRVIMSNPSQHSSSSLYPATHLQQHYVPLNVRNFAPTCQQTPKVLMKYDGKSAYVLCSSQPVVQAPQLENVRYVKPKTVVPNSSLKQPSPVAYQYMQPQLIYPPTVLQQHNRVQQPLYVATPMIPMANGITVPVQQSQQFQYAVSPCAPVGSSSPWSVVKRQKKMVRTPKQQPPAMKLQVDVPPVSVPTIQASCQETHHVQSSAFTAGQMSTLEKMIDFYSNKNNLSAHEKQIVRAIIAQHIRNQSLPLPTPDDSQVLPTTSSRLETVSELPSVATTKRKLSSTTSTEPSTKQKRSRKETLHQQLNSIDTLGSESSQHSPLLDVYMKVLKAESSNSVTLMKEWREHVRHLLKCRIPLHIPYYSRRSSKDKENKLPPPPPPTPKCAELVYEITSDDGYHAKGSNLQELVANLLDAVQECRSNAFVPPNSLCLASVISPHAFIGISHDAIKFLVEQLQGAKHCQRYKAKYYKHKEPIPEVVTHINPHGCARAEKYQGRSKPDMFSFLASKHRLPPTYDPSQTQNIDMQQNSTRRPTSMDLPMAMRFRHLKTSAREAVGVYRSAIHGRGLFCKRDIEAGEMVMEYTGEAIRCFLTDRREKMYEAKGIGCYMFRMDDIYVVDATMTGCGARFINHSCEPSCYSRIVSIDGRKHIIIFALRKILRGEELTYDYKFPIEAEDQKIMCNCGSKTCRKYMN